MVRKKSINSRIKKRKDVCKRQSARVKANRSWRILFVIFKAINIFFRCRRNTAIVSHLPPNFGIVDEDLIPSNCIGFMNEDRAIFFPPLIDADEQFGNFNIVKCVVENLVSKVCRREYERKRQWILRKKKRFSDKNMSNGISNLTRLRQSDWFKQKYSRNVLFRERTNVRVRNFIRNKYKSNNEFRENLKLQMRTKFLKKYRSDRNFRNKEKIRAKENILNKYHSDKDFRDQYKIIMKQKVLQRYNSNHLIRAKTIRRALHHYRISYTRMIQKQRQLYNQNRRIMKKYLSLQSHKCEVKHTHLYAKSLQTFRKKNQEGPDFICISCRLALFRTQVIPYVKEKYIKANMSYEMKRLIKSYINHPLTTEINWICKSCSDKIKKGQMPSRSIVNKLGVSEIPLELKNLNNLEKHLIALRLPFMKIINLTSGKITGRFAQKGTKGPLHCVPSEVQDTVTMLPRPIDKSMMIRLQLKRRLKYKAIWEEQLINPNDVRNALIVLTKKHPGYRNIKITEIDENYLTSDKENNCINRNDSIIEAMDVDVNEQEISIETTLFSNDNRLKRLALGDIDNVDVDNDEVSEDDDVRTKYNIGTDSCTQPSDFNDFLFFDKDPCVVAPAEKNKLSSLLTDKTIESLAFPHLFPDGRGSYDEDRLTDLKWKEYCKARLFSSDNRFASDSSYIFFLQYLGDLKQVFSGINVAFRKKLPMTVKQAFDDVQMNFLMNKDMIYRYLQSVRGSPQYWCQRLKDLFGMTRQLGFPTFFITLSCADMRWREFIDIFVSHSGGDVKESYTYEEKTKLLRANPVLAARLFERRFNSFMNLFIKGGAWCLGKIKDWYARIEMQLRGTPHAHMPLWVENAPKYNGVETDEKTRKEIVTFCDKYITTKFPSIEEDAELHNIIREVQTHSRSHSKSCLKYHKTLCRFGFPRPVARRTFICEPIKIDDDEHKERSKKAKEILIEINATMNHLEKDKQLLWSDFDTLLSKYDWSHDDYEWALRVVHTRPTIIHKREPNARWINQYNERMLRSWDANMDIQFILDPYACAKYLMSYTTKPEREMSLLLEETHKECREGNMSVREEMKKLTGTFFNHRQVSVQEAIYRASKMPLTYSSRGFVFVPSHSNSCKFLKPHRILKQMDPNDENIYMSNLADKYFDRPVDAEFDICMADFASEYEIVSANKRAKNPRTTIRYLQTLNFAVKKRCGRNAIIRYPYFNCEIDRENYFENLLSLYLPIRCRDELKKPFELFYETAEIFDPRQRCMRRIKDVVYENRKKYETHFKETDEMETLFNQMSVNTTENEWAEIVANKEKNNPWLTEIEQEENPDLNVINKKRNKNTFFDLKQNSCSSDEIKPLLESMNEEQQQIFYYVREWCINRLYNPDIEPLRLFITGGAGTGKSHLLKCLQFEATKIFSRKKHLEPDETIDEIHTLITAFTGAAAVNVGGVTIHSAFGIGTKLNNLNDNLSCDKLNSYRCKLGSLKLLFVDEVSLIQSSLWGAMHSRLTQIMGIHSNSAIFGNVGIIALGDFYQCSPVASSSIYSSLLWSDHFECVELKINERQKTNVSFAEMLNRIRKLKRNEEMREEDRKILENCHQRYLNKEYHSEALHLFAKNNHVDAHNDKMIKTICTDIRTLYEVDCHGKEIKSSNNKRKSKTNKPLELAKTARVMITRNICVSDGLANGVMGRVIDFVETDNQISHIVIKCDLSKVGRIHRIRCANCHGRDTICVTQENDNVDWQDNDLRSKKGTKQFPLRLSWAITIHKAQGVTVDEVVISTKDLFGTGMGYTGLSRVRTNKGLFLSDLYLKKFFCNENVDTILSQMKKMTREIPIFQHSPQHINILCHNIERLQCNFNALQNHYLTQKADIICLTETWLNDKNIDLEKIALKNYHLVYRNRHSSFKFNHAIHSQKGGGVAIYFRENLSIKKIDSTIQLNLEYITIEIKPYDITIVTCYRSPQQNKKEFLHNLLEHLKEISTEKKILLVGDLNEDSLQNGSKPIESKLEHLGFVNLFKELPTTNSLSSLDCIYSNFLSFNEKKRAVVGTYFSFHDALFLSINTQDEKKKSNEDIDFVDDKMDTNNSPKEQLSIFNNSSRTNKRKSLTEESNLRKIPKRMNLTTCDYNINDKRKEKQIQLLTTLKKRAQEKVIEYIEHTSTIEDQLASIGLKKVNILGDGNCFFRAISHQLYGHENEHLTFRAAAIDYLICNNNNFIPFIDEDNGPTIEHYIVRMSRNGTYADNLIITSMAIVINKNIAIHEKGKKPLLIPGSDFIEDQLHVIYYPNNLHYNSVLCLDDTSPLLSTDQFLIP